MEARQAIVIALAILVGGMVMTSVVLLLFKTDPGMLGISRPQDAALQDSTPPPPTAEELRIRTLDSAATTLEQLVGSLRDSLTEKNAIVADLRSDSIRLADNHKADSRARNARRDSIAAANVAMFAKIYDQGSPAEVARILSNLDVRDAAAIIRRMKAKNAAKVLEAMDPVRAAGIMTIGQALVEG